MLKRPSFCFVFFFLSQFEVVAWITKCHIIRVLVNSLKIFVVRGFLFEKHASALAFTSTHESSAVETYVSN